jgi:hypothetical protein
LRKNYFEKLAKYIKKVYKMDKQINSLSDERINPRYKTGQVILPLVLGLLLRIKSLNELNCMLKENEFKNLIPKGERLPQIDTIRDTLKSIDLKGLEKINISIIKKAIANKVFKNGTIDGHMVAAIDGTKIFGSYKKCCSKCLTTEIKGKPHYYHSGAVMSVVGSGPKLVLDYEMYNCKVDSTKKDEGK